MRAIDLFSLREQFNRRQIVFCFNGPISTILIEEIGKALQNYMQKDHPPSLIMDVFGVYVELTQNIRHYSLKQGYNERDSSATVAIANDAEGSYLVLAGNLVERDDAQALLHRCSQLAAMDKAELKAAYKKQLREPRTTNTASGAGLGLLDIARKASKPLVTHFTDAENGKVFFSLLAII